MAKVKIQGHASGTGILTVTAPNTSTDRTITLPDSTGTLVETSTTDALTTRVNGAGGRKNMIINGAMNVAQRATSSTGITVGGYDTVDRFITEITTLGTWSISQSTDAPDGFAYSLFHDCTTADASPASGDVFRMSYRFEGQDLQHLQKGTSSAKSCTVSFWIKSNKTGTGQFNIRDIDNTRGINKTYTINSADTWEYKTITIQGDTTGAISNDNGSSFWLMWLFNSGTNNSSGTFNSDWHAWDWTDINASGTLDIGASTSDYVKITGVQLELGSTATDFEHRSYGEELALCQRYYEKSFNQGTAVGTATAVGSIYTGVNDGSNTTGYLGGTHSFRVSKRTNPTLVVYDTAGNSGKCQRDNFGTNNSTNQDCTIGNSSESMFLVYSSGTHSASTLVYHFTADAEL